MEPDETPDLVYTIKEDELVETQNAPQHQTYPLSMIEANINRISNVISINQDQLAIWQTRKQKYIELSTPQVS